MSKAETQSTTVESDDSEEEPEIEDDLVKEELRIDGICGVY